MLKIELFCNVENFLIDISFKLTWSKLWCKSTALDYFLLSCVINFTNVEILSAPSSVAEDTCT